jgi:hypothetical protein
MLTMLLSAHLVSGGSYQVSKVSDSIPPRNMKKMISQPFYFQQLLYKNINNYRPFVCLSALCVDSPGKLVKN